MTEVEWLACTLPFPLLEFLQGPDDGAPIWKRSLFFGSVIARRPSDKATVRQFKLFIAASCRCLWHFARDENSRALIEAFDRYANGNADRKELKKLCGALHDDFQRGERPLLDILPAASWTDDPCGAACCASDVANLIALDVAKESIAITSARYSEEAQWEWGFTGIPDPEYIAAEKAGLAIQAELVRHIFGNPFRPVTVASTWRSAAVVSLAEKLYDERAFERMPQLADALDAAGCTNADILGHCRKPGPHMRGCWVVDLILGKQ